MSHNPNIIFILFIIFAFTSLEGGKDWPQLHGPHRDNKSTETGLLKKWPVGGPDLVWTTGGLGNGYAGAAIVARLFRLTIKKDANADPAAMPVRKVDSMMDTP